VAKKKAENTQIVKYSVAEAEIAKMSAIYMDLVITDLEDKEQFNQVRDARLVVKGKRVAVEKERKDLKSEALKWGKKVDGKAKLLFGLLEPIETHLQAEENKVKAEQERIEAEEAEKERIKNQFRVNELFKVGCVLPFIEIATKSDEEYADLLQGKTQEFEAEQEKKEKGEADRKAEEARLTKQKEEQDAESERLAKAKAEQEAINEKIEKDRIKLADQKRDMRVQMLISTGLYLKGEQFIYDDIFVTWEELVGMPDYDFAELISTLKVDIENRKDKDRIAKEEADKKAAEEVEAQAKKDAEDNALEKKNAEETVLRDAEEEKRQKALKPIKDRIHDYADDLLKETPPVFKDPVATALMTWTQEKLFELITEIKEKAEAL